MSILGTSKEIKLSKKFCTTVPWPRRPSSKLRQIGSYDEHYCLDGLGPARVLLREDDENGIPTMYWIGHKTQLLRCAPHHVRADFRGGVENALEEVEKAKVEVKELKSRGVTRYHDLNILNKASIDDVNTDEEFLEDDEEVQEPPRQRPRLTFEDDLPSTGLMDDDCDYSPTTIGAPENVPDPGGVGSGLGLEEPTLLQPPVDVANLPVPDTDDEHPEPPVMELDSPVGESTVDALLDETEPSQEPSAANTVVNTPTARQPSQPLPAPMVLDSITASYYEPVHVEDFASRRRRVDQQETMSVFWSCSSQATYSCSWPLCSCWWFRPTFWCRSTSATRQQ